MVKMGRLHCRIHDVEMRYDAIAHFWLQGAGIAIGAVFSVVLFRRRMWPVYVGTGTGFGFALNDLQHDLRSRT